jgi:hypothetical protein
LAEKHIQNKVVEYARSKDFLAFKINIGSQKGWPDYLFIDLEGYSFWMEFKEKSKKPNPMQLHRASQLMERNIPVFLCDNVEEGKGIIDAVDAARLSKESDRDASESGERRTIVGPGIRED